MAAAGNETFVGHRVAAGWTQESFIREYRSAAERLGLSGAPTVRTVNRWERADPPLPRAAAQQILESLFGVPLEQLGFTVPETRRTPAVERRRFLEDAGAVAALLAAPVLAEPAPVSAPAIIGHESGRVYAGHLRAIDAAIEGVYVTDHAAGSGNAQSAALDLSGRITALLSRGSYLEAVGRSLQVTLGQVTAHLAWLGYDAGQPANAVPFLQATLADLGDGYTRNSASYRAKLALVLLAAGEVDAACAEATRCAHGSGK